MRKQNAIAGVTLPYWYRDTCLSHQRRDCREIQLLLQLRFSAIQKTLAVISVTVPRDGGQISLGSLRVEIAVVFDNIAVIGNASAALRTLSR